MAVLQEYKCPCCDGTIAFDSDIQKLKCPYCDTEFEVETLEQLKAAEQTPRQDRMDWEQTGNFYQQTEAEALCAYVCRSCGGELVTESTTAATACPFCGNSVVLSDKVSGQLRPDCLIPFQLDREAAQEALKKHLSGKPLLPKIFKDENHIRQIKGVYVPFWLYDASADGDAVFHATRVRTWADSRYYYTETKHYRVTRAGTVDFVGVPVDGSSKMADDLMESLEPYDLSRAVDFQTAYLAGYYADRYDVSAEQCAQRANQRIHQSTRDELESTVVGYSAVLPEHCQVQLREGKTRYALYPVWLLYTRYRDTDYLFAMNGQTGKFVGDLPTDWGAFWKWWFIVFGIVGAVSGLIAYLAGYF